MQLIRTTIRLNDQLKKIAEYKALEENTSLQEIVNNALALYLDMANKKEAKKIIFKTHHLGATLDNLTRDNYYQDPQ
jgi:hypothetical protein